MKKLTNEEFLQKLKDKNIPYIPLEEYKGYNTKIKWKCYKHSNHIFESSPNTIFKGYGCPYCSGRYPMIGETDLWTTHPDVAKMLKNPEDGYRFTYGSGQRADWICPICGEIIEQKIVVEVVNKGLFCYNCSNGISYPEKFVTNMFNQLEIKFKRYEIFDWSDNRIYDFYIPSLNLIVETHGIQHYAETGFTRRSLEDEQINDKYKEDLALSNGISQYIVLDCRKSEKDFLVESITNSKISNIFDLSNIDWDLCSDKARKNYYDDILNYYNNGIRNPIDIANLIGLSRKTVIKALRNMSNNGICDYDSKASSLIYAPKVHFKSVICVETKNVYESMKSTEKDGFSAKCVSVCCRKGLNRTHKGYHWMYYEDYLKQNSEDNYGKAV